MNTARILLLITLAGALAACNTFSGMGRDIEAAGEAITGTADDTQEKM